MKIDRKIAEIVDSLIPAGYPDCRYDADKVLEALKEKANGHRVRYKGKIQEFDYAHSKVEKIFSHTVARIDTGHIVDINQPKGKRIFENGADYWKNSLNRISKYDSS